MTDGGGGPNTAACAESARPIEVWLLAVSAHFPHMSDVHGQLTSMGVIGTSACPWTDSLALDLVVRCVDNDSELPFGLQRQCHLAPSPGWWDRQAAAPEQHVVVHLVLIEDLEHDARVQAAVGAQQTGAHH